MKFALNYADMNSTTLARIFTMKTTFFLSGIALCLCQSLLMAADSEAAETVLTSDSVQRRETPVALPPAAQNPENFGGGMKIGGGAYFQSFDDFNATIESSGFRVSQKALKMFSCGFFGMPSKASRVGIDLEYLWSDPVQSDAGGTYRDVEVRGYSLSLQGGKHLILTDSWGILPVWGAGYYSHTYNFIPQYEQFEDILTGLNGIRPVTLRYSGVFLTAGLNLHLQRTFDKETEAAGVFHQPMFGCNLEGGLHYHPMRTLRMEGVTIKDGPEMARFGYYLKLYIDIGEKVRTPSEKNNG